MTEIHTCSYYCERPECVRRQRDELRDRMESALAQQPAAHPAITFCDNCGCDWLDNGLNPVECPYCKWTALKTENERLREVLKDTDDELDWLDKDMDKCDHSVGVCMCSYWYMRRKVKAELAKENINVHCESRATAHASDATNVVAWARPVYAKPVGAPEAVEGEMVDVEFHLRAERPEGDSWRPLIVAPQQPEAQAGGEAVAEWRFDALEVGGEDGLQAEVEVQESECPPTGDEVIFIDGVGAGRSSVKSCHDGVQWIRVGNRVYWPLSDSDAKRLQSACCGNGSFDGPTTPADEALLRQALEVLSRAHQAAMEQTLKARIPECAEFAGIAQDLDFVVAALRERLGEGEQQ